jgi:hypothetical protein
MGAMTTMRFWRISTWIPTPPNSAVRSSSNSSCVARSRNSECGSSASTMPCRGGGPADHNPPVLVHIVARSPAASPPAHRPRLREFAVRPEGPEAARRTAAAESATPSSVPPARMRMRLNMAEHCHCGDHQSIVNGFVDVAQLCLLRPPRSSSPRFAKRPVRRARCRSPLHGDSRSIIPTAGYYRRPNVRVGRIPAATSTRRHRRPLFGELVATAAVTLLDDRDPGSFTFVEIGAEPGRPCWTASHPFGQVRTGDSANRSRYAGSSHRLFQRAL